jgi:hypothetical protein
MATIVESTTDTPAEVKSASSDKRFGPRAVEPAPAAEKPADKTPEPKVEAAASGTEPEVEEDDAEGSVESNSAEDKVEASDKNQAAQPGKKKGGFQKKIDKMTKTNKQLEADLAALKAEKEAWTAGVKAAQQKVDQPPVQKTEGKPVKEKFKTQDEYIEALADWKFDQRQKESETKSQQTRMQTEREKMISDHNSRTQEFKKSVEDFDDALSEVDHIPFPPAMADIILNNDQGPAIMYAMAKDPENYERISKLPPLAMAREIGKIEAKLDAPSTVTTSSKKTTNAPAPVRSINGSPVVPKKTLEQAAETSLDAYKAARLSGARVR